MSTTTGTMCSISPSAQVCTRSPPSCSVSTTRTNHSDGSWQRSSAADYQALDAQIPNWREIDNSPGWRQWLTAPHEMSGHTRQQWLSDAMARGDAARVASFFRGFLQASAAAGQATPQQAFSAPTGKPTYTRADITRYSELYRKGRISETDYRKLEADIHAASKEGRITGINPPLGKAPYG